MNVRTFFGSARNLPLPLIELEAKMLKWKKMEASGKVAKFENLGVALSAKVSNFLTKSPNVRKISHM